MHIPYSFYNLLFYVFDISSIYTFTVFRFILIAFHVLLLISFLRLCIYHVLFHVIATRPCYTFHSSFSYLYYRILSYYMLFSSIFHILSSYTIHILHIHLYVLILSYTLCFRLLSVLFLYWFKANTFISHLYFSYYMNFYFIFQISRRSIRLILLLSLSYTIICFHISFLVFSYTFLFYLLSILFVYYTLYFLYTVFMYCSCTIFIYLYSCTVLVLFSYTYIHVLFIHILPYLVYFHITYLILSCTFIYILILFIYDTFVCFNLVLFMYCTFICLLLVSSLSSFISTTYYILFNITYIISYPIPISSFFSCSGYTPMLCYSFLTYCFIIYFLIRTCIVIYFHFILYCHIVLPYIFLMYFSYSIISYAFSYTVLSYYLSYTFLCH